MSDLTPLNRLAAEILVEWRATPSSAGYRIHALPYVEAMLSMRTCEDMYGLEYGDMIVAYALDNLSQWRGYKARQIKIQLKQHLEVYNVRHNGAQRK